MTLAAAGEEARVVVKEGRAGSERLASKSTRRPSVVVWPPRAGSGVRSESKAKAPRSSSSFRLRQDDVEGARLQVAFAAARYNTLQLVKLRINLVRDVAVLNGAIESE